MLERINEAEKRAREAETRAREAVAGVARPLDSGSPLPLPLPPEPEPEPIARLVESKSPVQQSFGSGSGLGFQRGDDLRRAPRLREASTRPTAPRTKVRRGGREPEAPSPRPPAPQEPSASTTATFEQLRNAGLSVTQTGRVLAHRERAGGFQSVDELDAIPGFPQEFLDEVKPNLTA